MSQELLHYQPMERGREAWLARIAELVVIANEDPALGKSLRCRSARSGGRASCTRHRKR
jgi:hypothetical protein